MHNRHRYETSLEICLLSHRPVFTAPQNIHICISFITPSTSAAPPSQLSYFSWAPQQASIQKKEGHCVLPGAACPSSAGLCRSPVTTSDQMLLMLCKQYSAETVFLGCFFCCCCSSCKGQSDFVCCVSFLLTATCCEGGREIDHVTYLFWGSCVELEPKSQSSGKYAGDIKLAAGVTRTAVSSISNRRKWMKYN